MSGLRLVKVMPFFAPATQFGGVVTQAAKVCERLAARGHQVRVVTTDNGVNAPVPRGRWVERDGEVDTVPASPKPTRPSTTAPTSRSTLWGRCWSLRRCWRWERRGPRRLTQRNGLKVKRALCVSRGLFLLGRLSRFSGGRGSSRAGGFSTIGIYPTFKTATL